jgi:hypothetical protein
MIGLGEAYLIGYVQGVIAGVVIAWVVPSLYRAFVRLEGGPDVYRD